MALTRPPISLLTGYAANTMPSTAVGGVSNTTVQGVIAELDVEKAAIASPTFTGTPLVPTAATGTNTTQIASTAFVQSLKGIASGIAPLDATSKVANTYLSAYTAAAMAFTPTGGISNTTVQTALAELDVEKAAIASPTFTGTPAAPTATLGDNSTKLATTAYAQSIAAPAFNKMNTLSVCDPQFMSATQYADAISGTPTLDLASPVQNALNYCVTNGYIAHIPQIQAKFGSSLGITSKACIESDDHGSLIWTSNTNAGFVASGASGSRPGYGHVFLPQLVGPNDVSGYHGAVANNSYSLVGFTQVGLEILDWTWGEFAVHQMLGWGTALGVYGSATGSFNLDIKLGTIDLCKIGINLAAFNSHAVGQSRIKADNIFAYYPLYLDVGSNGGGAIFEWDIDALGLHVAQSGGCCVFHSGVDRSTSKTITDIRLRSKAENGYFTNDSPSGTANNMLGPLVAGSGVGAASESGWADGDRIHYKFHLSDKYPVAGQAIWSKLKGQGSRVEITAPQQSPESTLTSKVMSTTAGESSFNGGAGGAAIHPIGRYVATTTTAITAGNYQDFYGYHSLLSVDNSMPLQILQVDNQTAFVLYTFNDAPSVNRQWRVRLYNSSASTIASGTAVNFWMKMPN